MTKHDHLYQKTLYGRNKRLVYSCKLCTHFLAPEFLIGKLVVCNDCLEKFEIKNKKDLVKVIKCRKCRKRTTVSNEDVLNALERLVGETE